MRRLRRSLRTRFGATARPVTVRATLPQKWLVAMVVLLLAVGYGLGYWRYAGSDTSQLRQEMQRLQSDNQALQEKVVQVQRQLQVEHAAQGSLSKEMTALQDEDLRLKEDVGFYKNILAEHGTTGVLQLHSVKVSKGARPGEYYYRILLVQSGRHDKTVQGSLQLLLNTTESGKPVVQHVEPDGQAKGIKVNFKYFQRLEGSFTAPSAARGQSLQVQFTEAGGAQPKLTQTVNLPT